MYIPMLITTIAVVIQLPCAPRCSNAAALVRSFAAIAIALGQVSMAQTVRFDVGRQFHLHT